MLISGGEIIFPRARRSSPAICRATDIGRVVLIGSHEKSGGIEFRPLGKKLMLSRGGLNRTSTLLIVVHYLIDPGTHRIASHKPSIPGL